MSSLVSEWTPSRFAFASAALNLPSVSCSIVPEPSRVALVGEWSCSGFLGGSGGTELGWVGSGSFLITWVGFAEVALVRFGGWPTGWGGFAELAFFRFGGLGRDCGFSQLDGRGFAYATWWGREQPLNKKEIANTINATRTRILNRRRPYQRLRGIVNYNSLPFDWGGSSLRRAGNKPKGGKQIFCLVVRWGGQSETWARRVVPQRQVLPSGHERRGSSEAYPYSARKDVVRQSPPTGQPTNRSAKL